MPEPRADETREEWLDRCMGDAESVADFPNSDQRFAFCSSEWEEYKETDMKTVTNTLVPCEVKEADDGELIFEGLASTWELDLGGDVIQRGAFARTLDHWRGSKKIIPLLDQHQYGSVRAVVGKLLDAKETEAGLYTRWQMLDSDDGREVYQRIKGGYIDGLSIGYRVIGEAPVKDGVRYIKEVALEEVSAVIWPMNPGARIMAVKAAMAKLSDEERKEVGALFGEAPAVEADPTPEGLAPSDPERIALEDAAREVIIRALASSTVG
jgi:HK97 family phage prohead protease